MKRFLTSFAILPFLSGLVVARSQDLPAGVPRTIWPDGRITVDRSFTTKAFQVEARCLVIQEANQVAKELNLPEKLPITEADLTASFVGPFGFTYFWRKVGNITTHNYRYGVEQDNKFSELAIVQLDEHCFEYRDRYQLPAGQIDKKGAFQLATQWLEALSMDVKALNRDCKVETDIDPYWNGIKPGGKLKKKAFVPIYNVFWLSSTNQTEHKGDTAYVQLFAPTKTILQLAIRDPKYILRKPLIFTNLADLFPKTNAAVITITNLPPPISGTAHDR